MRYSGPKHRKFKSGGYLRKRMEKRRFGVNVSALTMTRHPIGHESCEPLLINYII